MRKIAFVSVICAFLAMPVRAAPTVNIDFQPVNGLTYSGVGMAADSGTFWNAMSTPSAIDLMASDCITVTDIDVTTTYTSSYQNTGNALLRDRLIFSQIGGPPAISISGLEAGILYNVYLYAGYYGQTFTINGVSKTLTGQSFDLDQPSWTEGTQYVSFLGVSPVGTVIDIFDVGISGPYGTATVVSGMQIEQVQPIPAPGAILLGTIGMSLVGWLRRRKTL